MYVFPDDTVQLEFDSDVAADRVYSIKGDSGFGVGGAVDSKSPKIRKDFPESWIWDTLAK